MLGAQITNLVELSNFLGFAPQHVFFLVQKADHLYFDFNIPKATGGLRSISAPHSELKGVQRAILSKILAPMSAHESCYSYVKGRGVIDAAKNLCGQKAVLRFDLKDFFPSIHVSRVCGFFKKRGFNSRVSFLLARLTTHRNGVCQGAPTSPHLSNLIFKSVDREIDSYAKSWGLSYLRYSDDIFISGEANFKHRIVREGIISIVQKNSFQLNTSKTRYHPRYSPRYTLGLQTNGIAPELPRDKKRIIRAAFFKASHNWKFGKQNLDQLRGMAEWVKVVYGPNQQYREYQSIIRNIVSIKFHDVFATG